MVTALRIMEALTSRPKIKYKVVSHSRIPIKMMAILINFFYPSRLNKLVGCDPDDAFDSPVASSSRIEFFKLPVAGVECISIGFRFLTPPFSPIGINLIGTFDASGAILFRIPVNLLCTSCSRLNFADPV